MRLVASWSVSIVLVVAGCTSAATVACQDDGVCAPYGARCIEGLCRTAAGTPIAATPVLDLAIEPDLTTSAAPDLADPPDLPPGCIGETSCSTAAPICGADQMCRACVAADRAVCADRDLLRPRCDEASGACGACRVAFEALDCPVAALSICGGDGSCRQPCSGHADCASGICDPRIVTTGAATCARPEEVVHVRSASGCSGSHAGTTADPACTIDDAIALRPSGGYLYVHAGAFAQPRVKTIVTAPYVIVGEGELSAPDESAGGIVLHRTALAVGAGGRVHLEGMHVTHAAARGLTCTGGRLSLSRTLVDGAGPSAILATDCELTVDRSRLYRGHGGIVHDGGSLRVANTFINDNAGVAISVSARSTVELLAYLTIASNVPSASVTPGALSCGVGMTVQSSILFGNRVVGGRSHTGGCAFRASSVESVEPGVGNTTLAPQFTPGVPLLGIFTDYHLKVPMPYGEAVAGALLDFDGQARPLGGAYDIGADEL